MNLTPVIQNDNIYQIEQSDDVIAGVGGIANQPHQQLLNRLTFLDHQQEVYHQIGDRLFIKNIVIESDPPRIGIVLPNLFGRTCGNTVYCICSYNKFIGGILADDINWDALPNGTWLYLFIANDIGVAVSFNDFLLSNQTAVTGYTRIGIIQTTTRLTVTVTNPFTADNIISGPTGSAMLYIAGDSGTKLYIQNITGTFSVGNIISDGVGGSGTITAIDTRIRDFCQDGRRISWIPVNYSIPILLLKSSNPTTTWQSFNVNPQGWPENLGLRTEISLIGRVSGAADVSLWIGNPTSFSSDDNWLLFATGNNEAIGFRTYLLSGEQYGQMKYKSAHDNSLVRIYCTGFTVDLP